jgi:hypothetical protein
MVGHSSPVVAGVASLFIALILAACGGADDVEPTQSPVSEFAPFDTWISFPPGVVIIDRPDVPKVEAALTVRFDASSEDTLKLLNRELEGAGFSSNPGYRGQGDDNFSGIAARVYSLQDHVVVITINGTNSVTLVELNLLERN